MDRSAYGNEATRSLKIPVLPLAAILSIFGSVLACSDDPPGSHALDGEPGEAAPQGFAPAAARTDPRPSLILVVLDTTRADAVSSYGREEGTTPILDALAGRGTRFEHAYAPAPYTVASHATLFSGLRVDQHRVGLEAFELGDELSLIAERLAQAGYQTVGFSENPLLSRELGFARGFEDYVSVDAQKLVTAESTGDQSMSFFRLADRVRAWSRQRDPERPAFLFVNIMDSHGPYLVRDENRWVSDGIPRLVLEGVVRRYMKPSVLCRLGPTPKDQPILRGLYLGDVAAADAKLGQVLAALEPGFAREPLITVVTSDHGEHLGEHGLLGHRFTVRTPALQIPLVVVGAPDLGPATVEAPVGLRALHASMLCWTLGERCGASLAAAPFDEPIISVWSDESLSANAQILERVGLGRAEEAVEDLSRSGCGPDDPVFGRLASMIRYPIKINWAGDGVHSLHDLGWDPLERSNQLGRSVPEAKALSQELERFVEDSLRAPQASGASRTLSPETERALRALGYVE